MARLPTAEDLGQRPVPSGRGSISRLQLSTPRRGAEAQAEIQFGQAITGLGDTVAALALKEKARMDEAQTEEGFSQYQASTLELEYGKENGFVNVLGGEAVKRPLVEDYRLKREGLAKQIRESLGSEQQKIAFDKRASIADRQFDARIYRHVAEQSNIYQTQVSDGVMATERAAAALNYDMPGQIQMSLLRTDMEIERMARINGMDDVDVINDQKRKAGTLIHAGVINQMLISGKDSAASAYYNQFKSELTPEAMVALGNKVSIAATEGNSLRTADVVWGALGPKGQNEPVKLDQMETWIRERLKDNPTEAKAAIADVRSRAVAYKDQEQEISADNQSKVLSAFHDGADLKTLQAMPQYQSLTGDERVKLRDYIVGRGWTEQQHARSEAQYREGAKATAGFSTYWELSNPQVLNTLSEAQILKLEPSIGQTLVQDLMQAKRKLNDPESLKAATMDAELFNVIAADADLKPYEKNHSPEQKEYLGRLKNEVEAAIDVAQRDSGKALNREEKETLMRKMVDKKVYTDGWGTSTPSMPAPVVKPKDRSQIFVPIDQVDGAWLKGAINFMRSEGMAPLDWSDAQVKQAMKGRLERAYAISITGGTADEGKTALAGKDKGVRQ